MQTVHLADPRCHAVTTEHLLCTAAVLYSQEACMQHVPLFTRLCSRRWAYTEAHRLAVAGVTVQLQRQDILITIRADSVHLCT